jgi:NTP pyrophosphatase (non-canonical NTP hydrolase)
VLKTFKEYQDFTHSTAIYPDNKAVEYLTLGLVSEAGEVAGVIKKSIRDHTYFLEVKDKLKKEMGDVMWYIAQILYHYDLDFDEVLKANMEKLKSRQERDKLTGDGDER